MMKSRPFFAVACGVAIAAVVGSASLVAGATAANADSNDPVAAEATSARFAGPQAASDKLPSFLADGGPRSFDIEAATARLLGTDDGINYWVALNQTSQVCLISLMPSGVASMTCSDPDDVWAHGIGLQLHDKTHADRAYFIPAGYEVREVGYRQAGQQLLVGDATVPAKNVTVSRDAYASVLRSDDAAQHYGSGSLKLMDFAAATPSDLN